MLDFLKNLKNNMPIVTPNTQRQQANLDAMQAVSDFKDYVAGQYNAQNAGFSPASVDLINKIGIDNVTNGISQGLNNEVPEIADWISQYNKGIGRENPLGVQQPQQTQQQPPENQILAGEVTEKANAKTNLLNAFRDIGAGYRENALTPISADNFGKRIDPRMYKSSINPDEYNTALSADEEQKYLNWFKNAQRNGFINVNDTGQDYDFRGAFKDNFLPQKAGDHWVDKYKKPNHATFSNESQYATGENAKYAGSWDGDKFVAPRNENIATKIGEGVGTLARVIDNPIVKALIVGGAVSATGGSPAQALGYGVKTGTLAQQSQMRNNLYRQKLKSMGYSDEDLNTIKGYVGGDEYKNISDGMYKEGMLGYRDRMADIAGYKADADADYKRGTLGVRQGMLDVARQNAGTNAKRANIYQQIANRGGASGKPPGAKGSGAKNPMYGKHLAEYNAILQSGDQAKINYAQNKFIETYGEDPAKALKQESDILQLLDALENE